MLRSRSSWLIGIVAGVSLAAAPTRPAAVSIRWTPDRPVQGTLIRLTAQDDDRTDPIWSIEGELAGERLHFEADDAGVLFAYAGIPVDATGPLQLKVRVQRTGRIDSMVLEMPIARGNFKREKLTVARRFTDAPDSVLRARIEQEAALVAAVYRRSHDTPRLWKGPFEQPRQSRISSVFGTGREFNGVLQSRHLGTDFTGRVGEPIRATNDGVVSLVGHLYYSGNATFIDHGRGIVTAYLHQSETLVAVGDTVRKGQVIGRVGMTGRVTGPHLHWIAKYGRISVDPMSLLGLVQTRDDAGEPGDSTVATSVRG